MDRTTTTSGVTVDGALPPPSGPLNAPAPALYPLESLLGRLESDARAAHDARVRGVPRGPRTGLRALDDLLGGALAPGLHVLHGAPGVGKTALALQVAADCGFPAVYVTCEMAPVELLRRVAARVTGTYLGRLKSGELAPADVADKARQAAAAAPRLALADATTAVAGPEWLLSAARGARGDARHVLLVVDSVHSWALSVEGQTTEYERLERALASLRVVAAELGCPVLCLAERNRAGMAAGGLHASAGHRSFEFGAESVWSLDAADKDAARAACRVVHDTPVVLRLAKNRHGPLGEPVPLVFNGALQSFRDAGLGRAA